MTTTSDDTPMTGFAIRSDLQQQMVASHELMTAAIGFQLAVLMVFEDVEEAVASTARTGAQLLTRSSASSSERGMVRPNDRRCRSRRRSVRFSRHAHIARPAKRDGQNRVGIGPRQAVLDAAVLPVRDRTRDAGAVVICPDCR